jgi:hypothetical protein
MTTGYLTVMKISGDPDDLASRYELTAETFEEVGRDHDLILHAAAKADGGLLVVNLWPSRDQSEAAARDQRRIDAVAGHQLDPSQIGREHFPVTNWYTG